MTALEVRGLSAAYGKVEVLHDLIRRHPLGTLVAATPDGLEASHVPFEIDTQPEPFGTLRCHLARANPLWQQLAADRPVLVVNEHAARARRLSPAARATTA